MNLQKRYLELLRKALLNELYLENDARMLYMAVMSHLGNPIDQRLLQGIGSTQSVAEIARHREEGSPWWNVPIRKGDGSSTTFSTGAK